MSPCSGLRALALPAAAALLCVPAAYNGYPFFFFDTDYYITGAVDWRFTWDRPIFYSVFARALHWDRSLWGVVGGQALLVAFVLHLSFRVSIGRSAPALWFACTALLTALTSLPWFVGWVMADVFAGLLCLCMFALGYGTDRLGRAEIAVVVLIATVAVLAHLSHVPLALALIATMAALRRMRGSGPGSLALASAPLALALAVTLTVNVARYGTLSVSPYGNVQVLARLVSIGTAQDYLRGHCHRLELRLCGEVHRMPRDKDRFMWDTEGSPLYTLGIDAVRDEAGTVIVGALASFPGRHLQAWFDGTLEQLQAYEAGVGLQPFLDKPWVVETVRRVFPRELDDFRASLQNASGRPLQRLLQRLHPVHDVAVKVALGAAALLLVHAWRRRDRVRFAFGVLVLVTLLANAAITGGLSVPFYRYQSRVVWLVVLFALYAGVHAWRQRASGEAGPQG